MTVLADYNAPQRLAIGQVPRNPSGKIVKHELRAAPVGTAHAAPAGVTPRTVRG